MEEPPEEPVMGLDAGAVIGLQPGGAADEDAPQEQLGKHQGHGGQGR